MSGADIVDTRKYMIFNTILVKSHVTPGIGKGPCLLHKNMQIHFPGVTHGTMHLHGILAGSLRCFTGCQFCVTDMQGGIIMTAGQGCRSAMYHRLGIFQWHCHIGHAVLHILVSHTAVHVGQITAWRRAMELPVMNEPLNQK